MQAGGTAVTNLDRDAEILPPPPPICTTSSAATSLHPSLPGPPAATAEEMVATGRAWLADTPAWFAPLKTPDTELPSADMLAVSVESYPRVHFTFDAVPEDPQPHAGW